MEMNEYMQAVRKNWLVVLAAVLIGLLAGWGFAAASPKKYTSYSQIMFAMAGAESVSDINSASTYTMAQMPTYQGLAVSPVVMNPVAKGIGLGGWTDIDGSVSASAVPESVLLNVTAEADSPERARDVAQGVARELVKQVEGANAATSKAKMTPKITAPANLPAVPSAPKTPVFALAGGILGGLLGILAAVIREALRVVASRKAAVGREDR